MLDKLYNFVTIGRRLHSSGSPEVMNVIIICILLFSLFLGVFAGVILADYVGF